MMKYKFGSSCYKISQIYKQYILAQIFRYLLLYMKQDTISLVISGIIDLPSLKTNSL